MDSFLNFQISDVMKSVQWALSCAMRADGWTERHEWRKTAFRIL